MKYKNFDGSIDKLIQLKLDEIEQKEHVKILHAIESGSRAWGFESPDSDYDVRFIYIRDKEFYLRLDETEDYIDWELDEVLDINGWDITKALKLFYKSNGTLFEWANSPIVYRTTKEWKQLYEGVSIYFSQKATMYHYYGTAKSNYMEYLKEDYIKYKKYFYVIRPLLACMWIDKYHMPAPVRFDELKNQLLDEEIKEEVNRLLAKKIQMSEADKGPKIDIINAFIETKLNAYDIKLKTMENDSLRDWSIINSAFKSIVESR